MINALAIIFLAEILGIVVCFALAGHLPYIRDRTRAYETDIRMKVLSPYFGYSYQAHRERGELFTNNYGFLMVRRKFPAGHDYPTIRRDPETVIVGVFGGSVAQAFANTMQATEYFEEVMRLFPEFRGKRIEVLTFAAGGYKQPQQLLLLSYFLSIGQPFDFVMTIDGFNELLMAPINAHDNLAYSMPASFLYKRKAIDIVTGDHKSKYHMALTQRDQCIIGTCYLMQHIRAQYYRKLSQGNERQYYYGGEANPQMFYNFILPGSTQNRTRPGRPSTKYDIDSVVQYARDPSVYQDAVTLWRTALIQMKHLTDLYNIRYIHIIQPNQWYRPRSNIKYQRMFSEAAKGEIEAYAARVGYPILREMSEGIKEDIRLIDLSEIFDRVPSKEFPDIYSDDCCHFTRRGYLIMAREIALALAGEAVDLRGKIAALRVERFIQKDSLRQGADAR